MTFNETISLSVTAKVQPVALVTTKPIRFRPVQFNLHQPYRALFLPQPLGEQEEDNRFWRD